MTFALLPSPLLASGSGPVDLTGLPELPASCGILTSRAAVTSLGPAQQKPAFAVLEQAPAAAGVPTARAGRLTGQQGAGKLGATQGRCFLPNGQAAGRLNFPPPLCADDLGACHPRSQRLTHVSLLAVSQTFQGQTQRGPSPRSTDHGMAQVGPRKWLSPWPLLTYEACLAIDVGEGRRHFAMSLLICRGDDRKPSFTRISESWPKGDHQRETINPVILRDKIVQLFDAYGDPGFTPLRSLL